MPSVWPVAIGIFCSRSRNLRSPTDSFSSTPSSPDRHYGRSLHAWSSSTRSSWFPSHFFSPVRSVPPVPFLERHFYFDVRREKKINKIKDQRTFQTFVLATLLEFLILKEGINKGRIVKRKESKRWKHLFKVESWGKGRKEGRKRHDVEKHNAAGKWRPGSQQRTLEQLATSSTDISLFRESWLLATMYAWKSQEFQRFR